MRWLEDLDDLDDPLGLAIAIPDEPWCGEFEDHDCLGADCVRRPTVRIINVVPAGEVVDDLDPLAIEPIARRGLVDTPKAAVDADQVSAEPRSKFVAVMMG